MSAPKVFISYSHDSALHSERVLALTWALRNNGIDVELDQFHNEEILDWPRWCRQQIKREQSDFILCICTPEYQRRIEGGVPPEKGKGVYWEGSLLDDEIYGDKGNRRFIPVLFDDESETRILDFLRGWTFCRMSQFTLSDSGYEHLLRILTGQTRVEKNVLGTVPVLPTHRAPVGSPSAVGAGFKADISRIDKYAPVELIGREKETKLLNDAWDKVLSGETKRPHVLTFVALGGEGKTSLVSKWAAELAFENWPGCEAVFAWSFYSQGTREQTAASSDLFLKEALTFFGDEEMAISAAGAFDKGRRLTQLVGVRRALLILDGVEPLQYAPTSPTPGELKDQGLSSLLKGLAAANAGLCIVTTRYSITDLRAYWRTTAPEVNLVRLSREAGAHLLHTLGVKGSVLRNIPINDGKERVNEFEKLVEDVQGHALTLNLLGTYLRDAHGGDIRKRDLAKLEEANIEEQGGHAFRVMDAYVKSFESEGKNGLTALAILRLLGFFDRPVTADCFQALLRAPKISNLTEPLVGTNEAQRNLALTRLETARLLTVNRDSSGSLISLDAHPLLREYFATKLRTQHTGAWRAAHRRLYKHLVATTREGNEPTLEDLQPLYQAVAHGCQAGLQNEAYNDVYLRRIGKDNEHFAVKKLGAFGSDLGALASFFDEPWKRPAPVLTGERQAFLLNRASFRLRALGRLSEAGGPLRAALELAVKQENWRSAAARASNLSELELTLGEVAAAMRDAEQSVTYGDLSGDAFLRMVNRCAHADAQHQAGLRAESETRFKEAEQMQAGRQRAYLLYSLPGFLYSDLLLAAPERAAWRQMSRGARVLDVNSFPEPGHDAPATCLAVSQRAAQTLEWAQDGNLSLLTVALDHLTLDRAAFYEVVLVEGALPFKSQNSELKASIEATVDGLRRAAHNEFIVRGLLTRAWLRFLNGAHTGPKSAQEDLDEAWEIAERGPMRLFMADIHLYRARLFGGKFGGMKDEGGGMKYPWDKNPDGTPRGPKDDLAAARKLIEKCGYWRRKEELEDAEDAAKGW